MGQKAFWLILWWFFSYGLLHPMSYTLRFYQRKDLSKIYICGKFHQDSVGGCEVKHFQSFMYWLSIHEMVAFGVFLGSYLSKYWSIFLKFWPELVSNKTNTVFKNPSQFWILFHFGAQFTAGKPKILLKTKISAKTSSLGISIYLEETLCIFGLGPNWTHFRVLGVNNFSKLQVVLLIAQMPFKAIWKTIIFTEAEDVPKVWVFGPTLSPVYPLKMTEIKNSHLGVQISQHQSSISF